MKTAERGRLEEAREPTVPGKKWRLYLSERQWGTVREDYSEGGDTWNSFTHSSENPMTSRWIFSSRRFDESTLEPTVSLAVAPGRASARPPGREPSGKREELTLLHGRQLKFVKPG